MLFLVWTVCKIHPRLRASNKVDGVMYTYVCLLVGWLCFFLNRTSFSFATVVMQFSQHLFFPFILISDLPSLTICKIWLSLGLSNNLISKTTHLYYHCSLWRPCLLDALWEAFMWKLLPRPLFLFFLLYMVWHPKCAVSCKVNRI